MRRMYTHDEMIDPNFWTDDLWGRPWPSEWELCAVCNQPDNCGDCTHGRISDDDRIDMIYGAPA